jgi:hypothetical protein
LGDFKKLRTMMVDKPVFQLADPNDPVRLKLKPSGQSTAPAPVAEEPEAEASSVEPVQKSMETMSGPTVTPDKYSAIQKLMGAGADNGAVDEKVAALKARMPAAEKPAVPVERKPRKFDDTRKADDPDAAHSTINEIIESNNGDDIDGMLDQADNLDETNLSENDKQYVFDALYDHLRKHGAIDYQADDE